MMIDNYRPYVGQHCETTATGALLSQLGIDLSEPMLFGLGQGLGYIFWRMKSMDFPFIGGRIKTDLLTTNICQNLHLDLIKHETTSPSKAWKNIETPLTSGKAVGLKLDCYHLDYFTNKIHFAGHYATIYGYDDQYAYLNDTDQQGGTVKTTLQSLALARNEKGPMSSKNLSFTIEKTEDLPDLPQTIKMAIRENARDFLNPPIKNLGYKGIRKTATEIKKWFQDSTNPKSEFQTCGMLMERAGTGGALFRNLYRDFLLESADLATMPALKKGYREYMAHAAGWSEISALLHQLGETQDEKHLHQASALLTTLSDGEAQTMRMLYDALA